MNIRLGPCPARLTDVPLFPSPHQKGLSDDGFEQRYPGEEACRKAGFVWRWPEGFKCPRCCTDRVLWDPEPSIASVPGDAGTRRSLIAGTILQDTELPMRVWFRAMHLLAQGKKGLSPAPSAQADAGHARARPSLPARRRRPRIEIDAAYVGGERSGEGSGRGRRGHTPFIVAIGTSDDG